MTVPQRILYVTELVEMGGGERWLLSVIDKLDKDMFTPLAVCPQQGAFTEELKQRNVRVIITKFGIARKIFHAVPLVSMPTIFRFFRILKQEKINLVHSNNFSGVVYSAIPARLLGIPLVWSVHGWNSGAGLQGRFINSYVSKVIAVSSAVKDFISRSQTILSQKIEVIAPGVDLSDFSFRNSKAKIRGELGIPQQAPLIGTVGRLQEIKDHHNFLLAAKEVKKDFKDAKFLIVGARLFSHKADEGYEEKLKSWIQELGLTEDCIVTGFRNDIPDILSALDVFVLSSVRESFGLSVVEAMAAGVPVVSTRSQGPEDIIEDNVSGLLVPIKDPRALSQAITYLLTDKDRTKELTGAAMKRARDLFDQDKLIRRIETVYKGLL